MTRPQLTKDMKSEEFKEYYFLKEELKSFCRENGLRTSGNKGELEERIIHFLDTGKRLEAKKVKIGQKKDVNEEISLESKIGENFRCSQDKRKFFEKEIGKGFRFKVKFQKWLKENPDKTYRDAVSAYAEIQNSKEKDKIDSQFQYNQYIQDFFADNVGGTLEDAIECWKWKKSLKGHNRYEKSDLEILD